MARPAAHKRSQAPAIGRLLISALRIHSDRAALVFGDEVVSYADLDRRSRCIAGGLHSLGARRGDRVALLLPNGIEYVVADLAIARTGLVKVPLNDLLSASDVAYGLEDSGASILVVHEDLFDRIPVGEPGRKLVLVGANSPGATSFEELLTSTPVEDSPALADDPAIIMYTGGTTGRPKGIVHSAGALGTNLLTHVLCSKIRDAEVMLLCTPLPHSAGFFLQTGLLQGARVVITRRFDPVGLLDAIENQAVSWTFMVPTMIYRLLDQLRAEPRATASIETIVYGAAPISRARIEEALAHFGPVFLQIFGQSECPNFATSLSKHDHEDPGLLASCGQPCPGVEVRIASDDGDEVPIGEIGEVLLRSPYTLREYHESPELTQAAYHEDWLRTGDVGFRNATGHVFLVDRKKDMIITGGMNVYSAEVERVLDEHPRVDLAAVVGRPDADWGEAVHVFFVSREGATPSDLDAHCRKHLASYKIPKGYTRVAALPTTNYGKIDKKALRANPPESERGDSA